MRSSISISWSVRAHFWASPTRQLRGKLRELRFHMDRERQRITYYIATGRRIILLTTFRKSQRQETAEIDRAERAMERCIREGHAAEEAES